MFTVYILQSLKNPKRYYVGLTTNLENRIKEHNQGLSLYTKSFLPWEIVTYTVFKEKKLAEKFEKYLKSGSGYAFLKKRFIPSP